MIFQSAEIRWFFKGSIPMEISNWFYNLDGLYEKQESRTDHYLRLKATDSIGIKIREGRFEVKEKQSHGEKIFSASNVEGFVEIWTKWSFESNDDKHNYTDFLSANFISVEKTRELQKFIFDSKGNISGGFDNYHSIGCNSELTKVIVNKTAWWTLGLETYGKPDLQEKNLQIAFDHVFRSNFPGIFPKEHSRSYPQWLNNI